MISFAFIVVPEFRESLEADAREMQSAFDAGAWKACQVVAGSIIEATLVDFLVAKKPTSLKGRDPLSISLAEAIDVCAAEKVLTTRTKDLCSVIRSYRNLIHPGRRLRLQEEPPTQDSARIAVSLVRIIVDEVAKARRDAFGLTAEQVLAKLELDHNAIALLPHLLPDLHESERRRLLLSLLPSRYEELSTDAPAWSDYGEAYQRLRQGFRIILQSSSEEINVDVAGRFVSLLRSTEGSAIDRYASALFEIGDLQFVDERSLPLAVEYFASKLPKAHDAENAARFGPLVRYLPTNRIASWVDPYVRCLTSAAVAPGTKRDVRLRFLVDVPDDTETRKRVDARLKTWFEVYNGKENTEAAIVIKDLRAELADDPFSDFPGLTGEDDDADAR
jgi:hypothetical protein